MIRWDLEGPHACCMFISIGMLPHRDDECGHVQYDDLGVHGEHDTSDSTDLQTSLQIRLTREGPWGVQDHREIHTCMCGSGVRKYYTSIVV